MKVLHAAAEIFPLVKTGGLADVTGAILPALNQRGIDARIVLPGLPAILDGVRQQKKLVELGAIFGAGQVTIRQGRMPVSGVQVYIVDAPWLYIRDGNPYVGPDAVAQGVFFRCATEWDGFAVVVEEIIDAGDTIVVLGRYKGTFKATGRAQNTQMAHVWRVADGKAVKFQQFADTLHVARVIAR